MAEPANGNGSDNPDGGDAPKYVTEEQLNKAITAHFQRYEKKQDARADALVERITKQLGDQFAKSNDPDDDDPPPDPKAGGGDDVVAKLQRKFERERAEQQRRIEKIEKDREAERAKTRDMTLRQAVRDELSAAGIEGAAQRAAIAMLIDGEKRASVDDDGAVTFRDIEGLSVSLKDGMGEWLKSDDAKVFLPAQGVRGSGDQPRSAASGANDSKARQAALLDQF